MILESSVIRCVQVVKLLVTDELIDQVNAKMLQFTFLSVRLSAPESKEIEAKPTAPILTSTNDSDAALAGSEAVAAEEARRRKQVEAELAEVKSTAQAKDRERLEAQLQAKQDAQRAQELELARNEQLHARSLLEHELATRDQQNQELKQARKQLEYQLQATNENAQRFQINITSTDQALEASIIESAFVAELEVYLTLFCGLIDAKAACIERCQRARGTPTQITCAGGGEAGLAEKESCLHYSIMFGLCHS